MQGQQGLLAKVYNEATCDAPPMVKISASEMALILTGNEQLLHVPKPFLPQCSALIVNGQQSDYHVSISRTGHARPDLPLELPNDPQIQGHQIASSTGREAYLNLNTYFDDTCGAPDSGNEDLSLGLLADGRCHSLGKYTTTSLQSIASALGQGDVAILQTATPGALQEIFYAATCGGDTAASLTIYSNSKCADDAVLMSVPLEQFMNICYNSVQEFPGFADAGSSTVRSVRSSNMHDLLRRIFNNEQQNVENGFALHEASRDMRTKDVPTERHSGNGNKTLPVVKPHTHNHKGHSRIPSEHRHRGHHVRQNFPPADFVDGEMHILPVVDGEMHILPVSDAEQMNNRNDALDQFISSLLNVNQKVETRSVSGMPMSFQLVCSVTRPTDLSANPDVTGPQLIPQLDEQSDQIIIGNRPHHLHRPLHHQEAFGAILDTPAMMALVIAAACILLYLLRPTRKSACKEETVASPQMVDVKTNGYKEIATSTC